MKRGLDGLTKSGPIIPYISWNKTEFLMQRALVMRPFIFTADLEGAYVGYEGWYDAPSINEHGSVEWKRRSFARFDTDEAPADGWKLIYLVRIISDDLIRLPGEQEDTRIGLAQITFAGALKDVLFEMNCAFNEIKGKYSPGLLPVFKSELNATLQGRRQAYQVPAVELINMAPRPPELDDLPDPESQIPPRDAVMNNDRTPTASASSRRNGGNGSRTGYGAEANRTTDAAERASLDQSRHDRPLSRDEIDEIGF
jgi:hypothetical protein